jgi:hypothetical protein
MYNTPNRKVGTHFQLGRLKQLGVESLAQGLDIMAPGEVRTRDLAVPKPTRSPLRHHVHILNGIAPLLPGKRLVPKMYCPVCCIVNDSFEIRTY